MAKHPGFLFAIALKCAISEDVYATIYTLAIFGPTGAMTKRSSKKLNKSGAE